MVHKGKYDNEYLMLRDNSLQVFAFLYLEKYFVPHYLGKDICIQEDRDSRNTIFLHSEWSKIVYPRIIQIMFPQG
jgi:hypothetical protein